MCVTDVQTLTWERPGLCRESDFESDSCQTERERKHMLSTQSCAYSVHVQHHVLYILYMYMYIDVYIHVYTYAYNSHSAKHISDTIV